MLFQSVMTSLRHFLLVVVPLLLSSAFSFPLAAGPYDYHTRWRTIETKHFAIHFDADHEAIAGKVARMAEEAWESLTKRFNRHPVGKTEVVLVDTFDASNGFATVIPYNMMILRVVAPNPENNLGDYDVWLKELVTHEYTHIVHISDTEYPAKFVKFVVGKLMAPNGTSPGWIREGLAAYFETTDTTRGRGRSSFTDMLLRTDILQGKFLKLDQMAGTQFEWPSWLAQYLYGVEFMKFLAERHGEDKLIEFSHSYGSTLRLYALNSHAKKVFQKKRDPELVKERCEKVHWSDHGTWQVQKTYPKFCGPQGETFYDLWREWKASLEEKYGAAKAQIEKEGVKEGEVQVAGKGRESLKIPTYSPDGKELAYLVETVDGPARLVLRDLETGKERVLAKKKDVAQLSFSADGSELVFSSTGQANAFRSTSDLYLIELKSGKIKRLTTGQRARDPSFSPDGKKILFVKQGTGYSGLALYDLEKKEIENLTEASEDQQVVPEEYNHPRWSPDGRWIAVSKHSRGQRDLWLIDPKGKKETKLTDDVALEDRPVWGNGNIYYSSDRSGISNIYRYHLGSKKVTQLTHVLTGAYAPTLSSDHVSFQYYNGKGYEVREVKTKEGISPVTPLANATQGGSRKGEKPLTPAPTTKETPSSKPYRAFRQLLIPRYLYPNGAILDGSVFLSGTIGSSDPLQWHVWSANVNYRSDDNFVGYGGSYAYRRFLPVPFAGYSKGVVNYGDLYGVGTDYFEKRQRGFGGVGFPLLKGRGQVQYFFEDRTSHAGIPANAITFPTTGKYAGFHVEYAYGKKEKFPASISVEKGFQAGINVDITDSILGSADAQEQQLVYGDIRGYIPTVGHQVLALRAGGGVSFGDRLTQGNYSLGGSLGESPFTQTSTRLFTSRGMPLGSFSRDEVWIASAEYRFPLFRVQRGSGTWPFFLNSAHFAIFTDVGDAFNRGQTLSKFRPMVAVGAELRGDFVLGYGIPFTGRLGYGIVLTNRGRLAGLNDPFSSAAASKGVIVFDIGTSF